MAEVNIPVSRRIQLDPQKTFDYTTPDLAVVARPVGDLVPTEGAPAPTRNFTTLEQAGQLLTGLSNIALTGYDYIAQKQLKEGQQAKIFGKEKPDAGFFRIKAYEEMEGSLYARQQYNDSMQRLLQEAIVNEWTPEEYDEAVRQFTDMQTQGRTDNFISGFSNEVLGIVDSTRQAFTRNALQIAQERSYELLNSNMSQGIKDAVTGILGPSIAINMDNPVFMDYMTDTAIQGLKGSLHDKLLEMQERGLELDGDKLLGLDRKTTTAMFAQAVGEFAIKSGKPELMDVFTIRDASGIAPIHNPEINDLVESYHNEAIKAQNYLESAKDQQLADQDATNFKIYVADTNLKLANLGRLDQVTRVGEAIKLEQEIVSNPYFIQLSSAQQQKVLGDLQTIRDSTFAPAQANNIVTVAELETKAYNSELLFEDVMGAYINGEITQGTLDKYISKLESTRKLELTAVADKQQDLFKRTNDYHKSFLGNLNGFFKGDDFIGLRNDLAELDTAFYNQGVTGEINFYDNQAYRSQVDSLLSAYGYTLADVEANIPGRKAEIKQTTLDDLGQIKDNMANTLSFNAITGKFNTDQADYMGQSIQAIFDKHKDNFSTLNESEFNNSLDLLEQDLDSYVNERTSGKVKTYREFKTYQDKLMFNYDKVANANTAISFMNRSVQALISADPLQEFLQVGVSAKIGEELKGATDIWFESNKYNVDKLSNTDAYITDVINPVLSRHKDINGNPLNYISLITYGTGLSPKIEVPLLKQTVTKEGLPFTQATGTELLTAEDKEITVETQMGYIDEYLTTNATPDFGGLSKFLYTKGIKDLPIEINGQLYPYSQHEIMSYLMGLSYTTALFRGDADILMELQTATTGQGLTKVGLNLDRLKLYLVSEAGYPENIANAVVADAFNRIQLKSRETIGVEREGD